MIYKTSENFLELNYSTCLLKRSTDDTIVEDNENIITNPDCIVRKFVNFFKVENKKNLPTFD